MASTGKLVSIQGELLSKDPGDWHMPQDEVDSYVDRQTPEVLDCRERGRHDWPTMREVGLVFTEVDDEGMHLRRLICKCCKLAVRTEKWDTIQRGRQVRFVPVAASVSYRTGVNGESYLGPQGIGHMTSKQVRESLAVKAMAGQTAAEIRRETERRMRRTRQAG